jgi:hypothetical protein
VEVISSIYNSGYNIKKFYLGSRELNLAYLGNQVIYDEVIGDNDLNYILYEFYGSDTLPNTVEAPVKSAILKGQTLVNVIDYDNVSLKSATKENNGVYTVDVTIYPINIFVQTKDQVIAYVERFNQGVSDGAYNDYSLAQYEQEFSDGLLAILNEGCLNMTYADPVVVTVTIIEEDDVYYISDEDFLAIDAAMIATATPVDTSTPTDTE